MYLSYFLCPQKRKSLSLVNKEISLEEKTKIKSSYHITNKNPLFIDETKL